MKERKDDLNFTPKDLDTYKNGECPNCACTILDKRTSTRGQTCVVEVSCNGCGLVFMATYNLKKIEFDGWLYGKAVADVGRKLGRQDGTDNVGTGSEDGRNKVRGSSGTTDSKTTGTKGSKLGSKRKVRKQGRKTVGTNKDSKERRKKTNSKI